jgi:GNAT superfamily N-acetyltransferase
MCDEWMPTLVLPIPREQLQRLPRNAAYRYEFIHGQAYLTPRPKHYHALLELRPMADELPDDVRLRPVREADWRAMPDAFADAFTAVQPFGCLDEPTRLQAADSCLERTRTGGDGPWLSQASFVAVQGNPETVVGGVLITILPDGDPASYESYYWREPPPPDLVQQARGRPHLTWIFVRSLDAGHGLGSALLAAAVRELRALGYRELASTFVLGNDSTMLWHWRNGFRLLPHVGSRREMMRRLR